MGSTRKGRRATRLPQMQIALLEQAKESAMIRFSVGVPGFAPGTRSFADHRSTGLSYTPTKTNLNVFSRDS
jgi:hypothetical protein